VRDRRRGSHVQPVLTMSRFFMWWWLTVAVTTPLVAVVLAHLHPSDLLAAGPAFWLLVVFVVLGELRPVVASDHTDPDGVNLATAFLFAMMLSWGIGLALAAVVLSTAVGETARGKRLYAALFNIAQYSLSYLAAWGVLLLGGWHAGPDAPAAFGPRDLGWVVLAAAAYHLTNHVLVGVAVGLAEERPVWSAIVHRFGYYTMTTGAVLALSPLVVVVAHVHWGFLPLLLLPLVLLHQTAAMSLDRERRSLRDELTGLANRESLARHVARRAEQGEEERAALVLLDLDRFKEVNDTLGHAIGDQLLRLVAARLEAATRDGDAAGRLGGDEFVLVLGVTDPDSALDVAQRVTRRLREPYDVAGVRLQVEASAGMALLPQHGVDLEVLLRRADAAMYAAKEIGSTVVVFEPSLERRTPSRLQTLADLRRGLAAGELILHYQPKVRVSDGRVVGVEALVRWDHPTRGLLPPDRFLPLAERTAVMRQVTQVVLDQALAQVAAWRREGLVSSVAVNVSLHDLADDQLARTVLARLARHDLPPDALLLEITEEALVADPSRALGTLDELHRAGVGLSLDDFGTGHASLTRLKRVPVEEVKIDRQFVASVDRRAEDVAIVRSVVTLAQGLGLRTVAEGVETAEVHRVVIGLGCDVVQGWFLAPAMAAEELGVWLRTHDPDTDREAVHGR
jgi:diguanylate cyclase (GGDEF)-like protein